MYESTHVLPLCMPFKFFQIIFTYFPNISLQDSYLRLVSENEQLHMQTEVASLGLCGEPVGTGDGAAQSSAAVNVSASPVYAKTLLLSTTSEKLEKGPSKR